MALELLISYSQNNINTSNEFNLHTINIPDE